MASTQHWDASVEADDEAAEAAWCASSLNPTPADQFVLNNYAVPRHTEPVTINA